MAPSVDLFEHDRLTHVQFTNCFPYKTGDAWASTQKSFERIRAEASNPEKSSAAGGHFASTGDGEQFRINTRRTRAQGSNTKRSSAACGQFASNGEGEKSSNLIRSSAAGGQLACSPDGGNSTRSSAAGVSSKVVGTEGANLERTSLNGLNTQTVGDDSGNSQRISSNGLNSQMVGDISGNSQRSNANGLNSQIVGNSQRSNANGLNSQMVGDVSSNSQRSNANGLNSQMAGVEGVLLGSSKKRESKNVQDQSTFTSHPRHRARAAKNLENYLVKRVTNMMYQVRLEAVKKWCHRNNEDGDDTRACTSELTEEQYLTCWVEWCNRAVWALLAKYWTSDEYKEKRRRGQQSRMSCDDPAQNRGGSRNFAETTVLGHGMKHGRVPIDDGAVDKAIVLAHSKSVSVGHLILIIMKVFYKKKENRIYHKLFKATGSHGGSHSVDERRSNDNADDEDDDDDYNYHESDDDDYSYHQGNDHVQYSHEDDDDDHIDDDGCLEDGDDSSSSQSDDDHRSTEQ
ncbi:unnamed protein product [Miscanthus lutarioriparius]|uniref:Uncharacterized protein n=1 Tax=Miscanthus lutarioriparius TaxID=422564 RepID=A0A811R6W4_9POAL|nr:unnamed protein product [Miscanthus lutarioriparius]